MTLSLKSKEINETVKLFGRFKMTNRMALANALNTKPITVELSILD